MPIDVETRTYCENCGDRSEGRFCTQCTCALCPNGPASRHISGATTRYVRVCVSCYAANVGLTVCRCGIRVTELIARQRNEPYGTGTARTCHAVNCISRYMCYWCSNNAEFPGNIPNASAAMCTDCADNSDACCYLEGCTPQNLCDRCLDRQDRQREHDDGDSDDSGPLFFTQPPKFHEPSRAERKINRSPRMMAVEIEVSTLVQDIEIADVVRKWGGSIVEDGSIPGGIEINTSPAGGDIFLRQVDEICETLNRFNANADGHCGLHIHIDCRDHTYTDMRKLMLFYAKIEPALIRTQPYSRIIGGTYTRPCGKKYAQALEHATMPKELKKKVSSIVYGGKEDGRKTWIARRKRVRDGDKYDGARYNALNVHSWFYRGTVECRLHSGTVNPDKIKAWGLTWAAIVDRAYEMGESQIKALPNEPINILMDTAPLIAREALAKRIDKFGSEYDMNQARYGASASW